MRTLGALLLAICVAAGCEDLHHFEGTWQGPVSPDPAQQAGFRAGARLTANISLASKSALGLTLQLPTHNAPLPWKPMRHADADALGSLSLAGSPLRTFLGFVEPPGEAAFLVVVSLFPEDRVDVRVIRGPEETYGVFTLERLAGPLPSAPNASPVGPDGGGAGG